jgi:NADPH-dependent ferric siderophore reductase
MPAALRELVERGSTAVEDRSAREMPDPLPSGIDRVVFWAAASDPELTRVANACARRESSARRQVVVFVAGEAGAAAGVEIPEGELYVWPRDEDRLKLAFLTGA